MRKHPTIPLLILFILSLLPASSGTQNENSVLPVGEEGFNVMREAFGYDTAIPLETHVAAKIEQDGFTRQKIIFNGIDDNRVPGYLAIPKTGKGPFPCVLLLHGIGSSKESWWIDNSFQSGGKLSKQLLASGFAVLTLDAEYHGERISNNDFESPEVFTFQRGWLWRARDMIVQSAIENLRAIDYLVTRKDIDSTRIGIVGYSMGGIMVFQLAAIDPRIKVAVAAVTPILKAPYSAINVVNFAPYIINPRFLMQIGATDSRNYTKKDAQQLYQLIPGNHKELVIYESGHQLPEDWIKKATGWMQTHLK